MLLLLPSAVKNCFNLIKKVIVLKFVFFSLPVLLVKALILNAMVVFIKASKSAIVRILRIAVVNLCGTLFIKL
jgi:hypothetical protein